MTAGLAYMPLVVVALPLLTAVLLAFVPDLPRAGTIALSAAAATFLLACLLPLAVRPDASLVADRLGAHLGWLTATLGLAAAWFARRYLPREVAAGRLKPRAGQQAAALQSALLGFLLLAACSNDLGIGWVGLEAATIAGAVVVALPGTPDAIEAAWKYVLIGGIGVALALLGVVVLTLAALPAVGPGAVSLTWTGLDGARDRIQPGLAGLAFVFLLVGYGTKAALAPLHAWMPDAHAEGPTPISAVLAAGVLNVALVTLLRLRGVLGGLAGGLPVGAVIAWLGVASVLLAGFGLWRRGDVKRLFALSTIEQNGLAAVAIGIGGPVATTAAILQLTLHTLAKAAVFQCVGHAAQLRGGQRLPDLAGLLTGGPRRLGFTLAAAILAVTALPPSGLFWAHLVILLEAFRTAPLLGGLLALGLLVGFWALASRGLTLLLDAPAPDRGPSPTAWDLLPAWLMLGVVAWVGLYPPNAALAWLRDVAASVP